MIRWLEPNEVLVVGATLGLARLFQGTGDYLVDWRDAEPAGHAYLSWTEPAELQDLEVRVEYRRRGVATSLIAAAETACTRRGASRLQVTVSDANDGARELYDRLGFVDSGAPLRRVVGVVEIRTGPIEVDDWLVMLEKHLGQQGAAARR
jgi:ribosomal protein S18 acetylase RimI-like enzyme